MNTNLALVIPAIEIPTICTTFEGVIMGANEACCNLFGYTEAELIQSNLTNNFIEEFNIRKDEILTNPRQSIHFEIWAQHKNSHDIWIEGTFTAQINNLAIATILVQINYHCKLNKTIAEARKSQLIYQSLSELSTDAIFTLGRNLAFIEVNDSACRILGYSKNQLLTLEFPIILDQQHFDTNQSLLESILSRENVCTELYLKRSDGTEAMVKLNARMLPGDCVLIMMQEITTDNNDESINEHRVRLDYLTKVFSDAVWDWDLRTQHVYMGEGFKTIFGLEFTNTYKGIKTLTDLIYKEDSERVVKSMTQLIDSAQTNWEHEYRIYKADHSIAAVVDKGFVVRDDKGKVIRMVGAIQDITQRKKAEQHLKLLESVITNTTDAVLITEAEPFGEPGPRIVYVNEAFTKMTGYSSEEVIGKTPRILQGPNSDWKELKRLGKALRNWETCEVTLINYKKNGDEFWINMSISPVADENGWFTHWISIERDVTERKTGEVQQLRLTEEIRQLFSEPVTLNETLQKVLTRLAILGNYKLAEAWIIGTDQQRIHLVSRYSINVHKEILNTEISGSTNFVIGEGMAGTTWEKNTIQCWHSDDEETGITWHNDPDKTGIMTTYGIPIFHNNTIVGVFILGLDQKKSETDNNISVVQNLVPLIGGEIKRKQLEQELKQVFDFAPDIIFVAGFDGYFKKISPAALRLLEYTSEELMAVPINEFTHPDDKKNTIDIISLKGNNTSNYLENRYITKSGKIKWIAWTSTPSFEKGLLFGVGKDISAKKEAEEKIRFHANLLAAVDQAVIATDLTGKIIYWNQAAEKIYGWSAEEAIHQRISELTHPDQSDHDVNEMLKKLIEGTSWSGELTVQNKDGHNFPAAISNSLIRNETGKIIGIIGVSVNITERRNNELTLKKNINALENYKFALDQSTIISITDEKGIFLSVNDNFCAISKYSRQELIGKPENFLKSDFHSDEFFKDLWLTITAGKVWRGEIKGKASDGDFYWLYTTIIPFLDLDKKPYQFLSIRFDITEKKIAEEAVLDTLNEKNTILESIGDAFYAVDKDWSVTYWNRMAETVLGRTRQEILGRNLWELFPQPTESLPYKNYHLAIRNKQVVHFENFNSQLAKWHEISAYPSGDGLSVYLKDVTERKRSEMQLQELNEHLENKSKALILTNDELEQFAYVASHDLQEPLRMVTSFLMKLENKYGNEIDKTGKQYIGFAIDGAKRMRQIIFDLLEFSRVGRIEYQLENVDLNSLVEEIKILFRKQIIDSGATISSMLLPNVNAHTVPLRQVFQNLISNALKYVDQDVSPHITIKVEDDGKFWKFIISDNGIGISAEYFDTIFIIFQRLHNKDEFSGTGIGLAITKKIIEKQGGKIWIESEEGHGTSFYFTIEK